MSIIIRPVEIPSSDKVHVINLFAYSLGYSWNGNDYFSFVDTEELENWLTFSVKQHGVQSLHTTSVLYNVAFTLFKKVLKQELRMWQIKWEDYELEQLELDCKEENGALVCKAPALWEQAYLKYKESNQLKEQNIQAAFEINKLSANLHAAVYSPEITMIDNKEITAKYLNNSTAFKSFTSAVLKDLETLTSLKHVLDNYAKRYIEVVRGLTYWLEANIDGENLMKKSERGDYRELLMEIKSLLEGLEKVVK